MKEEEYKEGVKKTAIPLLFGFIAGILSFFSNPSEDTGIIILLFAILLQKFVFPSLHTNIKGIKEWLYISFMTALCWFISFSLLLNIR
ncbi:MAG: EMC6-like membrane protein [Candidatus Methanospirareceae archaeon]